MTIIIIILRHMAWFLICFCTGLRRENTENVASWKPAHYLNTKPEGSLLVSISSPSQNICSKLTQWRKSLFWYMTLHSSTSPCDGLFFPTGPDGGWWHHWERDLCFSIYAAFLPFHIKLSGWWEDKSYILNLVELFAKDSLLNNWFKCLLT